ncbi:hypothetical protein [Shewanella marisflavi]|uniref:hypothetical protein n=1 Tax=Shewanella marisflavi TaxID=260364 RepID=UPI003AAA574F
MINSIASFTSSFLENAARYLAGACFIFGDPEIIRFHQLRHMFLLDTKCLPFWRHERFILINMEPFVPFGSNSIIKIGAYDSSRYGAEDVYGRIQDFERLDIKMVWWNGERQRFVFQNLQYLPDTKKTFSKALGGYPTSKEEMESEWQRRKEMHAKRSTQEIVNILPYISKPKRLYQARLAIASIMVTLANYLNRRLAFANSKAH